MCGKGYDFIKKGVDEHPNRANTFYLFNLKGCSLGYSSSLSFLTGNQSPSRKMKSLKVGLTWTPTVYKIRTYFLYKLCVRHKSDCSKCR